MHKIFNNRIIEHLGNDLITSASVAVVELIKNSIDARSKRVNVQFFDGVKYVKRNDKLLVPLDNVIASLLDEESSTSDILLIEDLGIGMNAMQLQEGFLNIGTDIKYKDYENTNLGEKGIGRLAAQRLGKKLILETASRDDEQRKVIVIDWKALVNSEKIDEFEFPYYELPKMAEAYTRMWIIDVKKSELMFEGTILKMIQDCIAYLDTQIKEKTYLGSDGLFVTEEEYPKFVRQEIIVNAVTHRSYSITGTEIQVKMFDDRIVVESPGKLPGLVKASNIRHTHFSRNPRIAEYLKAYKYVKEYGEGVDRMCTELESAGLQNPIYYVDAFILKTIIYNASAKKSAFESKNPIIEEENPIIQTETPIIEEENPIIQNGKLTIEEMRCALAKKSYKLPTQENLLKVYDGIDAKQVFGASEIQRILDCSPTTSRAIMLKLREIEVVEAVKGNGKGRYVFKG